MNRKGMKSGNSKPDFICIGPEKTGTSWLYVQLKKHPKVFLPPIKEVRYFYEKKELPNHSFRERLKSKHWHFQEFQHYFRTRAKFYLQHLIKPRQIFKRLPWDLQFLFAKRNDHWYQKLFKTPQGLISGDISPLYYRLNDEEVAKVAQLLPTAKIIILLRNPVDRSWSKAKMNLCVHRNISYQDVAEDRFFNAFEREYSFCPSYVEIIDRWQKHFPPEQLYIDFYDKLQAKPLALLEDICTFLELDIQKIPQEKLQNLSKRVNKGIVQEIPQKYATHLAEIYALEIERLSKRFDSYPQEWEEKNQQLLSPQ